MRLLKTLLLTVAAVFLLFPLASLSQRRVSSPTDYELELARIRKDIAELKDGGFTPLVDIDKALKFLHRMYYRAQLTGSCGRFAGDRNRDRSGAPGARTVGRPVPS
jgi:hypothetical protein